MPRPRALRIRSAPGRLLATLLILLATLAFLAPATFARQDEAGEATADETEAESEPAAERFDSPRAAFSFFLESMRNDRDDEVVESGVLGVASSSENVFELRRRAARLYGVINRTAFVDVSDVPGPVYPADSWTWTARPPGDPGVRVQVRFVRATEAGWVFHPDVLENLDSLWAKVEQLPTVAEYRANLPLLAAWRHDLRDAMPEALLETGFLIEHWQWIALAALVLLCVVFDRIVRTLLGATLRRLAGRTELDADEVTRFERPAGILAATLLFQSWLTVIGLPPELRVFLDIAAGALATVAGVWAAYKLVDVVCGYFSVRAKRSTNKFDDMLVPLLRRTLKIFVTIVGLVYLASLVSEDLWGVVAGLSIGSLAVGFAARDSIENLFGTFTVLLDKPFQLGDWIVTSGIEGTVEQVGFRSTRIRTFYDSLYSVPNRHFISSPVDNYGQRRYRRIKTMLSLPYDTPPEKIEAFCEGVRTLLREHPYTRKDSYHVYLNAFSAASLDVLLYCFLVCPDWGTELREKQRLFLDVLRVAREVGVEFAFPTQTIHMASEDAPEHADRPGDDIEATRRGRDAGARVARETLRPFDGKRPDPVAFDAAYYDFQVGPSGAGSTGDGTSEAD